jgi:hypothetical protein
MILLNGPHIKYIVATDAMSTKTNLAIIAVVAAFALVTAGSFAATALAAKTSKSFIGQDQATPFKTSKSFIGQDQATPFKTSKSFIGQDQATPRSSSSSSTSGVTGTSSLPADYNMPHKTSRPNNDQVANSDQGSYSSNTAGSAKHSHLLANSDQGSSTSKTGGSNKDLAKLQSCISKAAKGPDGLSRSIVDICYDQTFYGNFNNQASNTGSNSDNQASNSGQLFNPKY